jgi:hypothetical protein
MPLLRADDGSLRMTNDTGVESTHVRVVVLSDIAVEIRADC